MNDSDIQKEIATLKQSRAASATEGDAYEILLEKYENALKTIQELKNELASSTKPAMPSASDVEAMSGMLDLLGKLDDATIERLNRFGNMNK